MRFPVSALLGGALLLAAAAPPKPPLAVTDRATDTYFGKTVPDPYRWMETPSQALDAWTSAQDSWTRAVLARIPGRDGLRRHMDDIAGHMTIVTAVTPVGHRVFFRRQAPGQDRASLVVRDTDTGRDTTLLDPNQITLAGRPITIGQFQPSQDGHYVAVGVRPGGPEDDALIVLDADTGHRLPETIDRARFASVSWLPDNRSFFYNRLRKPGPHDAPAGPFTDQQVFVHHLGAAPDQDQPVFGAGAPGTAITPTDFVAAAAVTGSRTVLGIQSDGVSPDLTLYTAQLQEGAAPYVWRRIATPADGIVDLAAGRDTLYLRTHRDAPRYRITAVPLDRPDLAAARIVLPQQDGVLTSIAVSSNALYAALRTGAASTILRVGADGRAAALKLPLQGAIAQPSEGPGALTADPRAPGAIVGIGTWVTPAQYFVLDRDAPGSVTPLGLAPAPPPAGAYLITETTAPAKDGRTRLPLSIIERPGTPRDHHRPVLVEGYGAYGLSEEPRPDFVPAVRAWVDAGGVMAIAHVRGGGELGEDWHRAGSAIVKQTSIHDFIDCAWFMTSLGYASGDTLAATGTGAGGIDVAGAITQIPSLFRAALLRDATTDTLRQEFTASGAADIPEFGTVRIEADFLALLGADAYQRIKPGTPYPAVLLTASPTDRRVPLWQAAKMTARLQANATRAKGPTLLRVEPSGGQAQADAQWADGFAFLLWQLGVPAFQLTH